MAGITCCFFFKPVMTRRTTLPPTPYLSSLESNVFFVRPCNTNFVKINCDPSVSYAFQTSITARYGGYRPSLDDSRRSTQTWQHPELKTDSALDISRIRPASERVIHVQQNVTKVFAVTRRSAVALMLSSSVVWLVGLHNIALGQPSVGFREYIDTFDGYSFKYPQNWIQVRGAGADIFFRDPFILDENISVELSSPSSSKYKSVEDLGPPQEAGVKVLRQYLTEFMSTRLGVRRESNVLSTSSRVADDGRIYYQVEVNIKSYANNNELAVMPQDRIARLEWNRRYLSVLGVENNRLYELRLQTPENVFVDEENDLRQVMDSFRVIKVAAA